MSFRFKTKKSESVPPPAFTQYSIPTMSDGNVETQQVSRKDWHNFRGDSLPVTPQDRSEVCSKVGASMNTYCMFSLYRAWYLNVAIW